MSPCFTRLQYKSFENAVGKGQIARNKDFFLFPQRVMPTIFFKFEIAVCKLFEIRRILNLSFGKTFNTVLLGIVKVTAVNTIY